MRLRACCVTQRPSGFGRAGDELDSPPLERDEEQHVDPRQRDCLDGQEVAGKHRRRLLAQEPSPAQTVSLRGGRQPVPDQDRPHRARRDHNADAVQLTDDPLVAPARVLPGEPDDELLDLVANRRPSDPSATGTSSGVPPVAGANVAASADSPRTPTTTARGSTRLNAASSTRSASRSWGRFVCRRRIESSCLNTTISSSFEPDDRKQSTINANRRQATRYTSDATRTTHASSISRNARSSAEAHHSLSPGSSPSDDRGVGQGSARWAMSTPRRRSFRQSGSPGQA